MSNESAGQVPGWVVFASIMTFGLGLFALFAGIADLINPGWLEGLSIFGNTLGIWFYAAFDLILAVVSFYAAYAIWQGHKLGFWLGIIFGTLSALRWFLFIPGAPIWALTMAAAWCLVLYGLSSNQEYFA